MTLRFFTTSAWVAILTMAWLPETSLACQREPTLEAQSCSVRGTLTIDDKTKAMLKSKCPLLSDSDISAILSLWQSGYRSVREATEANEFNVAGRPNDPHSCAEETKKVDRWVGFVAGGTWDETLKKCVRARC